MAGRKVEGREFGHLITGAIINASDKHANMAHEVSQPRRDPPAAFSPL
jgi:hypothetical protein